MRINFMWAALVLLFVGCSNDAEDVMVPVQVLAPQLSDETTNFEMDLGGSLELEPVIKDLEEGTIKWFLNGTAVSEESIYTYKGNTVGIDTIKFVAENEGGADTLTYSVQVFGEYVEGTFIVCMSSDNNCGSVSFLKEGELTPNVFTLNNPEMNLGDNLLSGTLENGKLHFVSSSGPNYVSTVNAQTMVLESEITSSEASSPGYIGTYGNSAYIVNAGRSSRTLHPVTGGTIGSEINYITDVPTIKSSILALKDGILVADGKNLVVVSYTDNSIKTIESFDEQISGIVTDQDGAIWIGTEGREELAKFRKLNDNLEVTEVVELDESVKLYRNGILCSAGTKYFYWQEPATGNIHRFNTETKTQELFVSPFVFGIYITSALKEHPLTGDVYIAGTPNFMDYNLIVLSAEGEKLSEHINVGGSPIDFIFSYKDLYRTNE